MAATSLTVSRSSTASRHPRGTRRRIDEVSPQQTGQNSVSEAPRAKQPRRRQIDPTTCERDYSGEEVAFMRAMDDYKRKSGRMFPTWSEVLEVLHCLGYRRVEEPSELPVYRKG